VNLALQTVGLLAASVFGARLLPGERTPRTYVLACLLASAGLFLASFAASILPRLHAHAEGRVTAGATSDPLCGGSRCLAYSTLDEEQANGQVGTRIGINVPYVDWARSRMKPAETYFIVLTERPDAGGYPHWMTYRMLPNLAVGRPEDADWIMFYDVAPRTWRPPEGRRLELESLSPTYALGSWRR
jgi:hypothetical protein